MRGDGKSALPDGALWQRSLVTDAAEDEAERLLDLAGFADGLLDPDDRDRVAELVAADPIAAGDVAAARALAAMADGLGPLPDELSGRACALVPPPEPRLAEIIPFGPRRDRVIRLSGMARWGSLVAAMAFASWLGFTLGTDTSQSIAQIGQVADEGFLHELIDPSTGFMRDLTDGPQT